MPQNSDTLLKQLSRSNRIRNGLRHVIFALSFAVIMVVFWSLKLTGIGVAGEAFCGQQEHVHTAECWVLVCTEAETEVSTEAATEATAEATVAATEATVETTEAATEAVETTEATEAATEAVETTEATEATENTVATAGTEPAGHIHNESCYGPEPVCQLTEHIHEESCYSDITADLETSDDWEMTLSDMARGPTSHENTVLVALSQLGYRESELNFQVDATGVRRGITRYGQWYGNPYGDWSAMFAAFCLHYAGVEGLPLNAGPEAMRLEWEALGLYDSLALPIPGNLVFLNLPREEAVLPEGYTPEVRANAVAVIVAADETSMTVVAGDWDNAVTQVHISLEDPVILGYGLVPEGEPPLMMAADPRAPSYTIWLDGTDGGLGYLSGSPNTAYTVQGGSIMTLPAEWTSPSKYSYTLRGWYDVTNSRYYPAGAEMEVTGNAVLYADWVASTYNLGRFNAYVADTVSTNSFITTYMFDYNYLFNIQSANAQVTFNNGSHSESWSMVTSGNVQYNGQGTYDFVFTDNDSEGMLNMPNNRSDRNRYHEADTVTAGIYSAKLGDLLFSTGNAFDAETGTGVLGKTYLGTADHLFQIMEDPDDEHYGYYYYDSKRNAASYSSSNHRFYVYDYLAATSDSIGGAYADFIPLNSPYANTNGKTVGTYSYAGVDGEYNGVAHYRYDSKYNSGDYNGTGNVSTDYAYGMRMDISFYLPNTPGTGGNKDIYGNDMQFQFSGDDDLWILIDGKVALDIGGIHQGIAGTIDFSTGQVVVNGSAKTSLMDLGIGAGDHTMTVLYLERGASMSNCAIYFNLAPRFGLELKKEDVLTQKLLDGTQFSVYLDLACTQPAELWESEEAYNNDRADGKLDNAGNTFTVEDGVAKLWGLGSGNTYYIKETGPPDAEGYGVPKGVIRLKIERAGQTSYMAEIISDSQGNQPGKGYTVHDISIDDETKTMHITVTNAPETVTEVTTVQVIKKWDDKRSHSGDYIQAYLTVTDPDGTIRRIREVTLSDENEWMYIWTNLPKYDYDTMTEVQYGVVESYESGYYSTVRQITQIHISKTEWAEALSFQNGGTYLLRSASGYLATRTDDKDTGYVWLSEAEAKESPNALWTATLNNGLVKFTNGKNQTITLYYNGGSPTDFYARVDAPADPDRQEFSYTSANGGLQIFYKQGSNSYYLTGTMNSSGKFSYSTNSWDALTINPLQQITQEDIRDVEDWAYQITNTPLPPSNETSMTVKKEWNIPQGEDASLYQEFSVTVQLLANGVNTGRSIVLNLKNNWQGSFLGLPYKDEKGDVIRYTVKEAWYMEWWSAEYGPITSSGGSPATYSTVITNTYAKGGPELPSTGSAARLKFILCGSGIMLGTLVYGIGSRRKRERRMG